jgi:hypothetical protein
MKKGSTIVVVLVGVALLWLAGSLHEPMVEIRTGHGLSEAEQMEDVPPLVTFVTVVLGGFRGLLVDVLWLRVSHLQEEGRYLELVQLSDWVTRLDPHCREVWSFHAWNMAYNASVMMPEMEDRWRWVRNGIALLRDRGIRYNRDEPGLYTDLSWLYLHKVGGISDAVNMYYRQQWVEEMAGFFPDGAADYGQLSAESAVVGRLRSEYKLLTAIMREVDDTFGRLDWRTPESHAVYWAFRGRQCAGRNSFALSDRMLYQSLTASFFRGSVRSRPDGSVIIESNLDLLPGVIKAYESALNKYGTENIRFAYAYFLTDAVQVLYLSDREAEARKTFELLKREFPAMASGDYATFEGTVEHLSNRVKRMTGYVEDAVDRAAIPQE